MSKSPKKPAEPKRQPPETQAEHLDKLLDEGLEETFPASDPPAVVSPGHEDKSAETRHKR